MHPTFNLNLPDALGLIGVVITLVAYGLLQTGKLRVKSCGYSLANIIGSVLIIYSLFFEWNLSAIVMESTWCAISIYGLCRALKQSSHSRD